MNIVEYAITILIVCLHVSYSVGNVTEASSDSNGKPKKKKSLTAKLQNHISIEAFKLSNQSFEAVKRGILNPQLVELPAKMKTNEIHLEEKVIVGTEEVQDVDPHFFAIPLPILFSALPSKPSEKQPSKSAVISFPSFVHDFSTPKELAQSSMQDEEVRQDFLRKLLKRLTSKASNNNKISKLTGKTVLEESIERLRDLHLLSYLQTYVSSAAMSELCGSVLGKGGVGAALPIQVQVELNMLLQSLEMSCDVDEE